MNERETERDGESEIASGCRKKLFIRIVGQPPSYVSFVIVVILAVQRLRMLVQFQNGFVWTQTQPKTHTHTQTHTEIETRTHIASQAHAHRPRLDSFLNMHEHLFELVAEWTYTAHT